MKKSKMIILLVAPILSTVLLTACGDASEETTRDVYQNREECLQDWGDQELCAEMDDNDSDEYRRSGGVYVGRPFWGPTYYPSDRTVIYKGRSVSPTSRSGSMRPFVIKPGSSAASRSSVSSPRSSGSTRFGGFGSRSSSGSS